MVILYICPHELVPRVVSLTDRKVGDRADLSFLAILYYFYLLSWETALEYLNV